MGADTAHTRHLAGSIPASLLLLILSDIFLLALNFFFIFFWLLRLVFLNFTLFCNWRVSRVSLPSQGFAVCAVVLASYIYIESFSSQTFVYFFSHFFFSDYSLKLFRFLVFFLAFSFSLLRGVPGLLEPVNFNFFGRSFFDGVFVVTPPLIFLLLTSSNIFTSVVVLESLALLSMAYYLSSPRGQDGLSIFKGFLVFFWVNALTSLLFFTLIIFTSDGGVLVYFGDLTASLFGNSDACRGSNLYLCSILTLTLFFKLGLPPFILWKVLVFNQASTLFVGYYSACFFPPILLFFAELLNTLTSGYGFNIASGLPLKSIFILILTSVLITLAISPFVCSIGSFFAISGAITTSLVFLIFIVDNTNLNTASLSSLSLYLILYSTTLIATLSVFIWFRVGAGYLHLSSLLNFQFSRGLPVTVVSLLAIIVILTLSTFAGLPPFLTFYVKLYVISNFVSLLAGFWWLTLLVLFFFMLLFFYYKNVRFLLIQKQTMHKFRSLSTSDLGLYSPRANYLHPLDSIFILLPPLSFVNFFGFFFLSELPMLLI